MLRKISVVIIKTWASLLTAESPVRRPTLSSPNVSLQVTKKKERNYHIITGDNFSFIPANS